MYVVPILNWVPGSNFVAHWVTGTGGLSVYYKVYDTCWRGFLTGMFVEVDQLVCIMQVSLACVKHCT